MGQHQRYVFGFFWAAAVIVSLNSWCNWIVEPREQWSAVAAGVGAVLLLARPSSTRLLCISVLTYLLSAFMIMPGIPNHRMVLVFAGGTVLYCTFRSAARVKLIPTLRWLTTVVYAFAVLAKINHDYLRADVSCAAIFLTESLQLHGVASFNSAAVVGSVGLSPTTSWIAWWSLLSELALIVLLIPARTRALGIVFGVAFHLFLATHYIKYFANFSCTMFLLLASWLSEEQARALVRNHLARRNGVFLSGAGAMFVVLALKAFGGISSGSWVVLRYVLWSAFGLYICFALARTLWSEREREAGGFWLAMPSVTVLILALINGASPYLGVKTRSGFAMYSNLRIEPNYSNHLFMPMSPDLFGYLSDSVRIVSGTDGWLSKLTPTPTERLPYISLCQWLAQRDGAVENSGVHEVSYERGGQMYAARRGTALPSDCPGWLPRKLLLFSSVGDGSERQCVW